MDWRHLDEVSAIGSSVYGELLNICVWNKSNAGLGSLYRSKHEVVYVYRVGDALTPTWLSSDGMVATAPTCGTIRPSTQWPGAAAKIWRFTQP
jgi:hypothetical protein